MLLSYATDDFHLFDDGAADMPLLIFIYSMMGQWIFIYSMMGQLTCKYELVWQEFSVESLILRWLLRPLGLLLNFVNVFLLFRNYLPMEMGVVLYLNKLESPSPKDALCQVWLELAQWFLRRRWKCEKFTDGRTEGWMDDGQQAIRKAHLSFQFRWAKKGFELRDIDFTYNKLGIYLILKFPNFKQIYTLRNNLLTYLITSQIYWINI